jgi:copper homeostasis protein
MSGSISIEVCVDSVASALAAERGGAMRVELCSSLIDGGVTPSTGLIELVRTKISLALHVIIRPRGGDFFYTPDEFEIMRKDILAAKELGADGVVLGILDMEGNVDIERTSQLVDLAHPLNVTFHRAIDMSADLLRAVEDIYQTGANRLLTSGGERTGLEGIQKISQIVKVAGGRIAVMACGGINHENAVSIVAQTGVKEIHVGLGSPISSPMLFRNSRVSMGAVPGREYERRQVIEHDVRKLHDALAQF